MLSDDELEASDADVAEQAQNAVPADSDEETGLPAETPLEADQADTAEQARELGPDDDEYR